MGTTQEVRAETHLCILYRSHSWIVAKEVQSQNITSPIRPEQKAAPQ